MKPTYFEIIILKEYYDTLENKNNVLFLIGSPIPITDIAILPLMIH